MGNGLKRAIDAARATRGLRPKYGNRKVTKVSRDGKSETFDSVREYERHLVLLDMQKRGEIYDLKRQVPFDLMVNGLKVGRYIADWTYTEYDKKGERHQRWFVVDDAKGVKTDVFSLKWKIMQAMHGSWRFRLS